MNDKPIVMTRADANRACDMLHDAWERLILYRAFVYSETGIYRPHADDIKMIGNLMSAEDDGNLTVGWDEALIEILMRGETLEPHGGDRANITNDLTVGLLEELGLWKDAES